MLRLILAVWWLRRRRKLAAPSKVEVESGPAVPAPNKTAALAPIADASILAPAKILVGRDPRTVSGYEAASRPSPN